MKQIPVHLLQDRTDLGLQIKYFKTGDVVSDEVAKLGAHRDDHYMFFVVEQGDCGVMIDFEEVQLAGGMLFYIMPAQVHSRIDNKMADGWYIAADTSLIPPECRNVFESSLLLQQPRNLDKVQQQQFSNLLQLLLEKFNENSEGPFYKTIIHTLLKSFLVMAACAYNGHAVNNLKLSRPVQLSNQFKNLLVTELRTIKSPAAYASRLHVSESYLNEAIKKTTGFSVLYWIQQEVMMEAKRLLYYSELNVKEIAHSLGYTDHSYFSRLFRKVTGTSALAFRQKYRK